ncbi:hypothetical protein SFRURICE_008582 [Spodoptera frugiperda]|nr:hypothetical protein SFRURICE_008582 [Spodoptera frugiperda]
MGKSSNTPFSYDILDETIPFLLLIFEPEPRMEHHPMTSLALGKALSAIFHERPLSTTALAITSVIGQVPINNTLTTQPVWKTTQGLYCGCTNCITRVPVLFLHTLADEDTPAKLLEKTWTSGQGQGEEKKTIVSTSLGEFNAGDRMT